MKKYNEEELNFWLNNLKFINQTVLKNQMNTIFIPFAKNKLSNEELKYFTKRIFRKMNQKINALPIYDFMKDERVVTYNKTEHDYDSWTEWLILKFSSIQEASKFVHAFDPEWADEINITPSQYDCSGQAFSSGMKFIQINEDLVFAYKRYDLDV